MLIDTFLLYGGYFLVTLFAYSELILEFIGIDPWDATLFHFLPIWIVELVIVGLVLKALFHVVVRLISRLIAVAKSWHQLLESS